MSYLKTSFDTWYYPLKNVIESKEFNELGKTLKKEYKTKKICPSFENIFKAFTLCKYDNLKVVILGQDPYHDLIGNQCRATGLAFANSKKPISPSLKNILIELENDLWSNDINPNLEQWAKQGVLLLNTALTVQMGNPLSHAELWNFFTKRVIENVSRLPGIVFILWGKNAQSYKKYMDSFVPPNIIESAHPSPFSANRGFFGSSPFSKANELLINKKIKWI